MLHVIVSNSESGSAQWEDGLFAPFYLLKFRRNVVLQIG